MKLNIRTEGFLKDLNMMMENIKLLQANTFLYQLPATRYNVHNEDELNQSLENSVRHKI